ncbi:hypothetical protein P43SY_009969 [Pythium insidiosum]|uniref:Uncharacterized protein n=1 Tax=Pythium insidiosum TaxID=114742 RepID=A0AAD5M4Y8_PYTIN|nr:hypothetical protein P43SY_009969 [Pythium insidiosum]
MFDGSFKSTRKVNLSGRKKPFVYASASSSGGSAATALSSSAVSSAATRDELLLQSKIAREERLAHKRRVSATLKIQALVRRVLTQRRVRRQVFQELERELSALLPAVNLRDSPLPSAQLHHILHRFLFVAVNYQQGARDRFLRIEALRTVQDYVVGMALVGALRGDLLMVPSTMDLPVWIFRMKGLFTLALQYVVEDEDPNQAPQRVLYLSLLETLAAPEQYQAREEVLELLLRRLAMTPVWGTFDAIRRFLCAVFWTRFALKPHH